MTEQEAERFAETIDLRLRDHERTFSSEWKDNRKGFWRKGFVLAAERYGSERILEPAEWRELEQEYSYACYEKYRTGDCVRERFPGESEEHFQERIESYEENDKAIDAKAKEIQDSCPLIGLVWLSFPYPGVVEYRKAPNGIWTLSVNYNIRRDRLEVFCFQLQQRKSIAEKREWAKRYSKYKRHY